MPSTTPPPTASHESSFTLNHQSSHLSNEIMQTVLWSTVLFPASVHNITTEGMTHTVYLSCEHPHLFSSHYLLSQNMSSMCGFNKERTLNS